MARDSAQTVKAAFLDASNHTLRLEHLPLEDALGPISFALHCHRDRYRSFEVDPYDARNALCFGAGPLAGAKLYGFHRLIFAARSPLWHGFFISSMGGAALPLYHTGVDYVAIEGRSDEYTLVALTGAADGSVEVQFEPLTAGDLVEIFQGYQGARGFYALQQYTYDRFNALYRAEGQDRYQDFRILAVGPAAVQTNFGAIGSTVIRTGTFKLGNDDWAGRGGLGSLMAQAHGVVAIAYGGMYDGKPFVEDLKDRKVVDALFQKLVHERYVDLVLKSGKKYRYDDAVKSAGTFGVNMSVLGEWLLSFNWESVKLSVEERKRLYTLVKEHYLKQFNEEIVEPRTFATCGEPCPLTCKKLYHEHKKDYEPYEALGPNAGIFDQRAAERVVKEVEVLGFDAIEFGNVSSWVLDCMAKGLIRKEQLGIEAKIAFDPRTFRIEDSARNAEVILKLAELVAYGRGMGVTLAKGVRVAAQDFDKQLTKRAKRASEKYRDTALYLAYGESGCISPIQYWVPGAFAPIPVQGKYLTNYCINSLPPRELGRSCADRAIKELYSEELGICRFHRGWTEQTVDTLLRRGRGVDRSLYEHCLSLMRQIVAYDRSANQLPVFWETKKTREVIRTYLAEVQRQLPAQAGDLERWVTWFARDEEEAARAYWEEMLRGYEDLLGE